MDNDIMQLIMPTLIARAGRIYIDNEEHRDAFEKAESLFEELRGSLNDEQAGKLENYFTAYNAVITIQDRLMYQQGMKDLLNFHIAILQK